MHGFSTRKIGNIVLVTSCQCKLCVSLPTLKRNLFPLALGSTKFFSYFLPRPAEARQQQDRLDRKKNWGQAENMMFDHVHCPIYNVIIITAVITSSFTIYHLENTGDIVFL